jgi:hypothetical protein
VDSAELQAQGGVPMTRQVKLPPGPYCMYAGGGRQLPLLFRVLSLAPRPTRIAPSGCLAVGVGSHRYAFR